MAMKSPRPSGGWGLKNKIDIPMAIPDLSGNEEKYVVDAIRSTWISSTGDYVRRFEREFAELCGAEAAVSTSSGTAALHLALLALDVRPGDEVLVPSLTYIATANAVRYVGAEPVFVDVDPDTWCIDPDKIEEAVTPRTKGIIPVHLYGHVADMDAINHLAAIHGLWVVEDAAEAHLARYKDRKVGGLARMATFSFYGNKILTAARGAQSRSTIASSKCGCERCAGRGWTRSGDIISRSPGTTFG